MARVSIYGAGTAATHAFDRAGSTGHPSRIGPTRPPSRPPYLARRSSGSEAGRHGSARSTMTTIHRSRSMRGGGDAGHAGSGGMPPSWSCAVEGSGSPRRSAGLPNWPASSPPRASRPARGRRPDPARPGPRCRPPAARPVRAAERPPDGPTGLPPADALALVDEAARAALDARGTGRAGVPRRPRVDRRDDPPPASGGRLG